MLSTVLVLGMLPGLAFFEAGLLNHKTTISLFMQMFCGLSVLALMWIVCGYRCCPIAYTCCTFCLF
jgi:Amt family ammonium transporter